MIDTKEVVYGFSLIWFSVHHIVSKVFSSFQSHWIFYASFMHMFHIVGFGFGFGFG